MEKWENITFQFGFFLARNLWTNETKNSKVPIPGRRNKKGFISLFDFFENNPFLKHGNSYLIWILLNWKETLVNSSYKRQKDKLSLILYWNNVQYIFKLLELFIRG